MILAKWMRSLRYKNDFFRMMHSDEYFKAYRIYICALLKRHNAVVRLAVLSDDNDVALGWSLIEGNVLHYVFVQREARNKGIAKSLVPTPIKWITHLTKEGMVIWNKKLPDAQFNPFL